MTASTNLSAAAAAAATVAPSPSPSPDPSGLLSQEPCGVFFPEDCVRGPLGTEDRFLVLVVVALAVITFALCVLACMLTVLVHKLSTIWVKALVRPAAPTTEPSDDPRKGLLQETKSSLRGSASASASDKAEGKKKKKASFAEDTSCAAPRDVDEEDL